MASAPPVPSSAISSISDPFISLALIVTDDALALDGVRDRLARDVVGGDLDLAGSRSRGTDAMSTGTGVRVASISSAGPRPDSVRIAGCTPGQLAKLGDGLLQLADRAAEQPLELRIGRSASISLGDAELDRQRDEALLRTVVQVALDPPALVVAGRDEAGTRLPDALELGLDLRLELGVLEGEPGCRCGGLDQLGIVEQDRVVDECRDVRTVVIDERDRASWIAVG